MTEQERTLIHLIRSKEDPEYAAKVALQAIAKLSKKQPPREKQPLAYRRERRAMRQ